MAMKPGHISGLAGPLIALLDRELPGFDGVDLCTMAKSLKRENPIHLILLTGQRKTEDILFGLSAGADDYISKPCNYGELRSRATIAEVLVNAQLLLNQKIDELARAENQARKENS